MRHVVTVMRPAEAQGTLGEIQGQPTVVYPKLTCSIEPLNGQEGYEVRQAGASRTSALTVNIDPRNPIKEQDYCLNTEWGVTRTFHVAYVEDPMRAGRDVRLVCGENL